MTYDICGCAVVFETVSDGGDPSYNEIREHFPCTAQPYFIRYLVPFLAFLRGINKHDTAGAGCLRMLAAVVNYRRRADAHAQNRH